MNDGEIPRVLLNFSYHPQTGQIVCSLNDLIAYLYANGVNGLAEDVMRKGYVAQRAIEAKLLKAATKPTEQE